MSEPLRCEECGAKLRVPTGDGDAKPVCPNGHEPVDAHIIRGDR